MSRLVTFVASVAILQKPDGLSLCAAVEGSDLADVTDTPDFEDFADWAPHPLAA